MVTFLSELYYTTRKMKFGSYRTFRLDETRSLQGFSTMLRRMPREISNGTKQDSSQKGFPQKPGVDFGKIYEPVIKYETLRFVLALVGKHRLKMIQVHFKSYLLNE